MAKMYSATPAHAEAHADETHAHESGTGLYVLIGVTLAIVTAVEVLWPTLGLSAAGMVGGLVALMILKGTMVVMWFMHLKGDNNAFVFVFLAPFMIAIAFVMGFLFLFAGTHPGIAG